MIVYPKDWRKIGVEITPKDIEKRLMTVLREIDCNCLSFSGGVDSSLLLYYMCQIYDKVKLFTTGLSGDHPDVMFAESVVEHYGKKFDARLWHYIYRPTKEDLKGLVSPNNYLTDAMVKAFYEFVAQRADKIIAGDVVDEYTCGYYAHMDNPTEEVYYDHIRRLQKNHLAPLNKNSGDVRVYLPYADEKVIAMLSQIPLKDKVDFRNRKKVMVEMARGKVPDKVILRRKYGFCDALILKK